MRSSQRSKQLALKLKLSNLISKIFIPTDLSVGIFVWIFWLYVNSWGNPKNEIEIFNKWQKIKLSLVFAIDRQTYAKYDCGNA